MRLIIVCDLGREYQALYGRVPSMYGKKLKALNAAVRTVRYPRRATHSYPGRHTYGSDLRLSQPICVFFLGGFFLIIRKNRAIRYIQWTREPTAYQCGARALKKSKAETLKVAMKHVFIRF